MSTSRSQSTIDAIIRAAHDEFSELGPGGARVDRIATSAGVNKQRLYAYFDNKEGLFAAVLSRAFAQLTSAVPIPRTLAGLRNYAGEVFDYHQKDPTLVRLLAWEGLDYRERALDTAYSRAAYYDTSLRELAESAGADTERVACTLLAIVGVASWPHVVPQQRRLMTSGTDRETSAAMAALRDAVADAGTLIANGLVGDK